MLATLSNPLMESPPIRGLRNWEPRRSEKNMPMRRTSHGTDKRKSVVYRNLVCNPYHDAHNIMFSYGRMSDSDFVNSAIYQFVESDWAFLELASGELARLARMSQVLPGFCDMIRRPANIIDNFCYQYRGFPESLYSSVNRKLPENELRYRLALYAALGGELFNIFVHNYDKPLARAICAVLFSRPYRQDWLECKLQEIEDDTEYLASLFKKYTADFNLSAWQNNIMETCFGHSNLELHKLILNCQVLRQIARKRGNPDSSAYVEPKPRLSFSGIPSWFLESADIYEAARDIAPLPPTSMALRVNPISNAIVPMYPALDECDLPIALVPESKAVWDAMIRIYKMARHDDLFPEAPSTQILLSPQNTHFSQEMSDRYNLIYLGLQSLGRYVADIGKLEENGENPDYQFHAFAIEEERGARRNHR